MAREKMVSMGLFCLSFIGVSIIIAAVIDMLFGGVDWTGAWAVTSVILGFFVHALQREADAKASQIEHLRKQLAEAEAEVGHLTRRVEILKLEQRSSQSPAEKGMAEIAAELTAFERDGRN